MFKKKLLRVGIVTVSILAIPLVMMQISKEWDWKFFDFVVIGALLVSAGIAYELIASRLKSTGTKLFALVLTIFFVLYVWAELAVGIFF